MNVGATTGALTSAAGAPLSQTAGAEAERTQKEAAVQRRLADSQAKSEQAAGIGLTEHDQEVSERDADGRQLWEEPPHAKKESTEPAATETHHPVKDPTGVCGNELDLTG